MSLPTPADGDLDRPGPATGSASDGADRSVHPGGAGPADPSEPLDHPDHPGPSEPTDHPGRPSGRPDSERAKLGWAQRRREKIAAEVARNRRGEYTVPTWVLALALALIVGGWAALVVLS